MRRHVHALNREAEIIRTGLRRSAQADVPFKALNDRFFGPAGFSLLVGSDGPESGSVAAVLEARRGTCVGLAVVYLALAQRLALDAHAVATPDHLFVRVKLGERARSVELLEAGREIDDDTYRRRYRIDQPSIAAGVFLRELSTAEVVANLLSNQAVAMSRQSRFDDALARYDAAIALAPQLVAAWYNRGLDLMNVARLHEALASFDHAIELYPGDAQAHNNRGLARFKLGDVEGARSDWVRALELQPGMKEAQENMRSLLSTP